MGQSDKRFSFGENWLSFLEQLDDERIAEAERSLQQLCCMDRFDGKAFLDIGSGSGLFSLAARRLGAHVHSFDYDHQSVAGTRYLRDRFFRDDPGWIIDEGSVLDRRYVSELGKYDIVYSWGVLHHTGAMYEAITNAATRVKEGGHFVFALYRKTRLCWFWKLEKRWYSGASSLAQRFACFAFTQSLRLALILRGRSFEEYVARYKGRRGMNYAHDVKDWLGGYPYESITPDEVESLMSGLGFGCVRRNVQPYGMGFFGSGCDEFVYCRK